MITKMTRYDFIMLAEQGEAFIQDISALGLVDYPFFQTRG